MRNNMKKFIALFISAVLMMGLCGCSPKEKVTKVEGREEVAKLANEFYKDILEEDHITMTSYLNGEITSIYSLDGNKIRMDDKAMGSVYYMFEEAGNTYVMYEEEGEPLEDSFMYEFYKDNIDLLVAVFVTGILEAEDNGALTYSATKTDKTVNGENVSELVTVVSGKQNETEVRVISTGIQKNGKVTELKYETQSGENDVTMKCEFDYENYAFELPEHKIFDLSQFCHHVESPYATLGDAMATVENLDDLRYTVVDNKVLIFIEQDSRNYQLTAEMPDDAFEKYENLDFFAEDYVDQEFAIFRELNVTDCVDFTEARIPQDRLNAYVGKTVNDMFNDGFEANGWMIGEEAYIDFEKDKMCYTARIDLPADFDVEAEHEYTDFGSSTIAEIHFTEPSMMAMPLQ